MPSDHLSRLLILQPLPLPFLLRPIAVDLVSGEFLNSPVLKRQVRHLCGRVARHFIRWDAKDPALKSYGVSFKVN